MEINHIIHWGQISLFPHIEICSGTIDEETMMEDEDNWVIFLGWLIYDMQIMIPKRRIDDERR